MSFQFNSDKERIEAQNPTIVGAENFIVKAGSGSSEQEIFRAKIDETSGLARVGINRTGRKVEKIEITSTGTGYTVEPNIIISPPDDSTGVQARATAVINSLVGTVASIIVDEPGDGYTSPPTVSIIGGGGSGAAAEALLDSIDYELDINGAIRTSTSIISDTARILNLDIDNFVTPDAKFRAPTLKIWANGTGNEFVPIVFIQKDQYRYYNQNIYQALNSGITGQIPPTHTSGVQLSGEVQFKHVGYRLDDQNLPFYGETGDGIFPKSVTPQLGDKSDKIATTEYVLNLATNDVGGRIYVSQQIGDDSNDGRSAVAPVRTIKRACQIATISENVKETVVISGGDYVEDNPISIPPDCSIVGDNLRLVIVRPANPRKHMFKFGDKNYLTGLVFRDQVDSNGDPVATWDFAMVFDDKQRIYYDKSAGGDFGRDFPIGHQIFGEPRIRADFQDNSLLSSLTAGLTVRGVNTAAVGTITSVNFNTIFGSSAYTSGFVNVNVTSGSFNAGETFECFNGENSVGSFVSIDIKSTRAEGEVVSTETDITSSLPIIRIDFSQQGTPEVTEDGFGYPGTPEDMGGIIFYTNDLIGRQNVHDFKDGEEIEISGLGNGFEFLEGKQRIYKVLRDADGRSRRFVLAKKTSELSDPNFIPPQTAVVNRYSYSVTLSLLNSPNKFEDAQVVERRYQDACVLIKNNIDFIADEAYLQTLDEFPYFSVPNETKCRRDIKHFLSAIIRDLEFGSNYNVIEAAKTYVSGTEIGFIKNEITETVRAFDIARRLAILAMRNWRTNTGLYSEPVYEAKYSTVERYYDPTVIEDTSLVDGVTCSNVASAIDTLGYLFTEVITNNTLDRYLDASYLIARNQEVIIEEVIGAVSTQFPDFYYPGTDPDGYRFKDARNLIYANLEEIQDRALAEIAVEHPDFVFPGDPASDEHSRFNDAYRLIQQNKAEIQDRALAEIAINHPDFVFPGDPASDEHSRYNDAYRLIQENKGEIVDTAWNATVALYPGIATTETKCKRDLGYLVDAVSLDVFLEGNVYIRKFTSMYFDGNGQPINNGLLGEEAESVYAFNQARDLMKDAITNQLTIKDLTVTADPITGSNTDPASCANVQTLIDNLIAISTDAITNGTLSNLPAEDLGFYQNNELKCRRDIGYFIDAVSLDVFLEGNKYSRKFVLQYFDNGNPISNGLVGEETESITAFEKARDVMKLAITNNLYVKDLTITADPVTGDNQDPTSCANVQTAIDTLTSIVTTSISAGNTSSLPAENIGFYQTSEFKCRRDIGYIVKAVANDLYNGGNTNIILATQYYFDSNGNPISNGLLGEESQSITAFTKAGEVMKTAIANGLYEKDLTITADPITGSNTDLASCANVQSAIDTLITIINTAITDGNLNSLPPAEEGIYVTGENKCKRDSGYILSALRRDLTLGGNSGILNSTLAYFTGTQLTEISTEELQPTLFAFAKLQELSILAMRNWKTGTDGTGPVYEPNYSIIPVYTDETITIDPLLPICNDVATSINTLFDILINTVNGTYEVGSITQTYGTLYDPAITYPTSTIYDVDNKRITVRSTWDDLPYIEASPYTQNASVISFLGGGGAEIDGAKVQQPNCPFPGIELDGSATYPNQGKSMVAAAFTIVSFGGTGYKIVNDGYCQLVSVFVLFAADGVLAENGGYASITNSATNFGIYALRATGYREEAYPFDVAIISNVSATPAGRTIFTIEGLGREPLEHYVVKIDGYRNTNTEIEYFIDDVTDVTVGPPFSAKITLDSGSGGPTEFTRLSDGIAVSTTIDEFSGKTIRLHRPSIVNSSSHTWEYAGAGTNYNALPENGGTKIEAYEQVSENYGRVYSSGTDELGDFKVGTFAKIQNRTGEITFTGTVTISEVEFLKLKGGDVVVTGFDSSNTLGGANSSDSKIPTQKAVRDYITNNLGPYINKPYSTNPVPRALVELTDSGKISIDQIPALRPFNVYTVQTEAERTSLEGALAGDIAIQQLNSEGVLAPTSYILNNDNTSLFFAFIPNNDYEFTIGSIYTGDLSSGQIQSTEYRKGVVYQIVITNPGSGYTTAPTITISGGDPEPGYVEARAVATIASGQVVTAKLITYNGLLGGKGYTTQPTLNFSAPAGSGVQAEGFVLIESRLYGNIVNDIKLIDSDTVQTTNDPPFDINITRVVNTSAFLNTNWVSLSSDSISASQITDGVIETARLALNSSAANSFTFLRGDQTYSLALQSLKGSETRYFARTITTSAIGSSTLVFNTNSDLLRGHELQSTIAGIPQGTLVSGVLTVGGTTTIELSETLTAAIPSGSILEFTRGSSPLILESNFTKGNFVNSIIIQNDGSGYTDGEYFDLSLSGGTGTGLRANFVVSGGSVTEVIVTSGGENYTNDFLISSVPLSLGSGSGLILAAKVSTVNRMYANTSIDIQRVSDATISSDLYGTVGVARFLKSQFDIGNAGNGSVALRTGADSGLDADLLDGVQGSFYLNASNLSAGTISTDRLSGTYNISISGQAGNTLRIAASASGATTDPLPSTFSAGIVADLKNNTANLLSDGGTANLVLTIRNFGSGFDASGGGVRQLAFTDNDNMWLRGSGSTLDSFGTWAKIWSSLNDGADSGLDADKLDSKQGVWYQNALNINFGVLSNNRIPNYMTEKSFNKKISILDANKLRYRVYISGRILTDPDFDPGSNINLYNSNAQNVADVLITNKEINDDPFDDTNDYTVLSISLESGSFTGAVSIGTATNRILFHEYTIDSTSTYESSSLENVSGNAILSLGRIDGISSNPSVYFRSSLNAASSYNAAIVASGGNSNNGSGSLDVKVLDANSFSVNNNVIWNAGNITFNTTNTANSAVFRDANGNFSAGTITASLTGAASLNVLKSGDTMSGSLTLSGSTSNLNVGGGVTVSGTTALNGNVNIDSGTIFVNSSTNRVGFGTPSPEVQIHISENNPTVVFEEKDATLDNKRWAFYANSQELVLQGFTDSNIGGGNLFKFTRADEQVQSLLGLSAGISWLVISNAEKKIAVNKSTTSTHTLDVNGTILSKSGIHINDATADSGAPLYLNGSINNRNFRISNQIVGNDLFDITPSSENGGSSYTTPALVIKGSTGQIGINTTTFSSDVTGLTVDYQLNVNGNINFNGTLYANNEPFVTSRWNEATNEIDIYRASKVGIGASTDPNYTLDVAGDINLTGKLLANDTPQWVDAYGVIKTSLNIIDVNAYITDGIIASSVGEIFIQNDAVVTIGENSSWYIQ